MPDCECLMGCPFFNDRMKNLSVVKDMMKKRYCLGDNSQCARYIIFKARGRDAVPPDLIPNQVEIARAIQET